MSDPVPTAYIQSNAERRENQRRDRQYNRLRAVELAQGDVDHARRIMEFVTKG